MPYRAVQSASQSVKKIYQMYKREGGGGRGVKGVLNNVKKDCVICKSGHPLLYMKEMKSLK